ncbi:MAG: prephenate dehydrogenase/arogenate dehydrogenase family protein [Thermodesulfobacteria bacterium]|nr:prephenate dehydrogenase/arogenate dehydrogenase family protein [Thermodesulfobacteriota bacterium]
MGRWFKRQFEREGYEVLVSDRGTPLNNRDLAKRCEVIFVSVPMPVFGEVVQEIGPLLSEEQGLIDFCSLKKVQNELMLEASKAEVVAAHPLFGPGEKDLEGQKVAMWPSRGRRWFEWFRDFVEDMGGEAIVISPGEHDRVMAIVQVINHFMLLALGRLIEESGIAPDMLKSLATPSFARQLDIVARFADQDPYLYAAIQFDNPEGEEMRRSFLKHVQELADIASRKDLRAFVDLFRRVQGLGEHLKS